MKKLQVVFLSMSVAFLLESCTEKVFATLWCATSIVSMSHTFNPAPTYPNGGCPANRVVTWGYNCKWDAGGSTDPNNQCCGGAWESYEVYEKDNNNNISRVDPASGDKVWTTVSTSIMCKTTHTETNAHSTITGGCIYQFFHNYKVHHYAGYGTDFANIQQHEIESAWQQP